MPEWEAPAKVNLDLRVGARDRNGLHPLRSIVQTVDWLDLLAIEVGDDDILRVEGADLPTDGDNLIWKAVSALDPPGRPALDIVLHKSIPVAAGLGGGSSDAAAVLAAMGDLFGINEADRFDAATRVGADVPFLLSGGTALMEGHGERISVLDALSGFALGLAVPPFPLATADVYARWDDLVRPVGPVVDGSRLPPGLRSHDELRNDLTPAAVSLRPELADWITDLAERWSRPVLMSGSGPACFAFFVDADEAAGAVEAVGEHRGVQAAALRPRGVDRAS